MKLIDLFVSTHLLPCLLFLCAVCFGQMKLPGSIIGLTKCDLMREKGPTAVKRHFKMQLTPFSL